VTTKPARSGVGPEAAILVRLPSAFLGRQNRHREECCAVRTFSPKQSDITRAWLEVDATGMTLGRLATEVASRLRGKHKVIFSPHVDTGDHIIIVNADKIALDAKKGAQKRYYRHSGYPGGLTSKTYTELLETKPAEMVRISVRGMLPHNTLGRQMLSKLKVYAGPEHPHVAQAPVKIDFPRARKGSAS
jgi:large subunit ribosomal protein L13